MPLDPIVLGAIAAAVLASIALALLVLRPLRIVLEADREEGQPMRCGVVLRFLGIRLLHASATLHIPSLAALESLSGISGEAQVHGRLRRRLIEAAAPRVRDGARWLLRRIGWRGLADAVLARREDLRFRRLEGRIEYAMEDPAASGRLYGQVMPWLAWLDAAHHFELTPRWTFENAWAGQVRASLDLWLLRLVIGFVWRLTVNVLRASPPPTAEAAARA